MKLLILPILLATLAAAGLAPQEARQPEADRAQSPITFTAVDIYLDSGDTPLAAYQVEIRATQADSATVVGIEGGEPAPYAAPPYYDPAALQEDQARERIVLAAYSTEVTLPSGRARVARLHLRTRGPAPDFTTTVIAAGDAAGARIQATAHAVPLTTTKPGEDQ